MFIPLKDNNPLVMIPFPYVNVSLIAINVAVFVIFQSGFVFTASAAINLSYGAIPAVIFDTVGLSPELVKIPQDLSLVTYSFLHGGWVHLISNMLFLWVLGDNVEDAMGHLRYLAFYLLCAAAAGLAHSFAVPASRAPLIGASGAVAGVMGAYILLYPRVRIWILLLARIPLPIPAVFALGAWIGLQFFNVFFGFEKTVAWWAHIGGFAAGALLILVLRNKSFRLFGAR